MTRRVTRSALLTLIGLGVVFAPMTAARADCMGPTFTHTAGDVGHGATLTINGYGFGDNCYDTGPPPPGQGALGAPLTGIEVWLEQDGERHLVAVGDANESYEWQVNVAVPAVLDVGTVDVFVSTGALAAFDDTDREVWVTSPADPTAAVEIAGFGPVTSEPAGGDTEPEFAGTNWTPALLLVGTTIAAGALLVGLQRRVATRTRSSEKE